MILYYNHSFQICDLVIEVPANLGIKWSPNVEYIFEFSSPDLSPSTESYQGTANPSETFWTKLKAQVRVQAFNDHTLRAQLYQVRFYTANGPTTLKTAHEILSANELAYDAYYHEEEAEFIKFVEEPMMFSLKRGLLKNMIVSADEPSCVTMIKKSLFAELQNIGSTFGLKLIKKQPIMSVLQIALKAKKIDV